MYVLVMFLGDLEWIQLIVFCRRLMVHRFKALIAVVMLVVKYYYLAAVISNVYYFP